MDNVAAEASELEALATARSLADPGILPIALQAIRELGKDAPPFEQERLERLLAVEERFQELLREDGADVLTRSAEGSLRDSDISFAQVVQRLCAESAIGMQRFLRNREKWSKGASQDALASLTARALHAMHCFAKWGCFLGNPAKSIPWKQLHGLYFLAESQGFGSTAVELQPWHPGYRPTPQALYVRSLLLDMLQGSGLTPPQLEIADSWFGTWAVDYRLDTTYRARDHLFCVDLAGNHSLEVVGGARPGDSVRYFRAEGLGLQLDRIRAEMREGKLYSPIGSAGRMTHEDHLVVLSALERFRTSFMVGLDNRLSDRDPASDSDCQIIWGMQSALEAILGSGPVTPAAGWRVYNRSLQSYGLMADAPGPEAYEPGALVAIRDGERRGWLLGTVVHRTRFGPVGAVLAGVEVIAEQPSCVSIERRGSTPSDAIFAPGADATGRFDALVLRESDYADGAQALLRIGDKAFRIRLSHAARQGLGWVKTRFFVEGKD